MNALDHDWRKLPARGSGGDMAVFATRFLIGRLAGFRKDMQICLTSRPAIDRPGVTHAYFPGLMNCCAMLEYLAGLYRGNVAKPCGVPDFYAYADRFMPSYARDDIRLLVLMFRHRIAHHGIASGVWIDHEDGRRIGWVVGADLSAPAIRVIELPSNSKLINDPPWECGITHRARIKLGRLWHDIEESVERPGGYMSAVAKEPALLRRFVHCMKHLYPD